MKLILKTFLLTSCSIFLLSCSSHDETGNTPAVSDELSDAVGVTFIKNEDGASVYKVESGNYQFVSQNHQGN